MPIEGRTALRLAVCSENGEVDHNAPVDSGSANMNMGCDNLFQIPHLDRVAERPFIRAHPDLGPAAPIGITGRYFILAAEADDPLESVTSNAIVVAISVVVVIGVVDVIPNGDVGSGRVSSRAGSVVVAQLATGIRSRIVRPKVSLYREHHYPH
jgi:hypothetical protein